MPRSPRDFHTEGYYHVINRGNARAKVFHDEQDYRIFLRILLKYKLEHDVSIFHYCPMPNHFHLLLRLQNEEGSLFMQKVASAYATHYCNKYEHKGHVWQGRFKSERITSDAYLLACGNYIEMNPVRAGLVRDPSDWPYSSFHYYASGKANPLITENPLFGTFGKSKGERRSIYRAQLSKTRTF